MSLANNEISEEVQGKAEDVFQVSYDRMNKIKRTIVKQDNPDFDDSCSSDEETQEPSIFKIMAEKHGSIEHTVSIIKKEMINYGDNDASETSTNQVAKSARAKALAQDAPVNDQPKLVDDIEIDGLNNLLNDNNVQKIIQSVTGGQDTTNFISNTLESINQTNSIQDKRAILSGGIKQLHSDLKINRSAIKNPLFNLALGVAGLTPKNINMG